MVSGTALTVGSVPGALRNWGPCVRPSGVDPTLPHPSFHNSLFKDSRGYLRTKALNGHELWPRSPDISVCCQSDPFKNQISYCDILGWGTLQPEFCIYKAECMKEYPWDILGPKVFEATAFKIFCRDDLTLLNPEQNTPNHKGGIHTLHYINTHNLGKNSKQQIKTTAMIHEKGCNPLERIMISLHWFWVAPIMPGNRCFAFWASSKRVTLMEFLKGTLHLIWEFDLIGNNKIVIKVVSFKSCCRNVRWLKEWVQSELYAIKVSLLKRKKKNNTPRF